MHFGGPRGKRIRDNYRSIRTSDGPSGRPAQLMREIQGNTKSFTFRSPQGLLFATQFSQPALVMVQKAAFEELVQGGFVPDQAIFAGHSLGEYAALASFADVLSIEALVETVFLRGMVMQNAVPRDAAGRSEYGMVAANPSRVGKGFSSASLEAVVELVQKKTQKLIQIVNFNVAQMQYVVAGQLLALDALSEALKVVPAHARDAAGTEAAASAGCATAIANREACARAGVPFVLRRGTATIPLPGIDVPFHSRQLLAGVPAFRQLLEPRLDVDIVSGAMGRLVGKVGMIITALDACGAQRCTTHGQPTTNDSSLRRCYDAAVHPERDCRAVLHQPRVRFARGGAYGVARPTSAAGTAWGGVR